MNISTAQILIKESNWMPSAKWGLSTLSAKHKQFRLFLQSELFKGTASVISSDPQCKDDNARFTSVQMKH